jgi:outer membrane protein assembly factor BamB
VWSSPIGGQATVTDTAPLGFGYPELVQSMLAHSNGDVWAAGYFAMTVHHPKQRNNGQGNRNQEPSAVPSDRFDIGGEPKSMTTTADGTVIAGLYPSTNVVAIDPNTYQVRSFGPIDNDQMRPLAMAYDVARDQVLVATTAKHRLYTGALTFVDPHTGEMDVRRDLLPDQNLRNVVVAGDYAYVAGDTFAEATSDRNLLVASIAEIDLRTRTVTRTFQPREWDAYEDIHVEDGLLYALGRRPSGAWFALDLTTEEVVLEGAIDGTGGLSGHRGHVYSWDGYSNDIQQLPAGGGSSTTVLYEDVPNGWYNRPEPSYVRTAAGAWGLYGTRLAWFPLPD